MGGRQRSPFKRSGSLIFEIAGFDYTLASFPHFTPFSDGIGNWVLEAATDVATKMHRNSGFQWIYGIIFHSTINNLTIPKYQINNECFANSFNTNYRAR